MFKCDFCGQPVPKEVFDPETALRGGCGAYQTPVGISEVNPAPTSEQLKADLIEKAMKSTDPKSEYTKPVRIIITLLVFNGVVGVLLLLSNLLRFL